MAYNSYFPVTYQPYQQTYYQPVQPQIQQPVQQQQIQPQSSMIWVSGEREAQMYPVAPNNAVTLWSQTEPVVYLKTADATGKPTLKVYDLVERTNSASNAAPGETAKEPAYATKDDLSAVVGVVKGFDGVISGIKSDIESMKSDMYGIAGKKKAVKKAEVDEDA